MKILLITIAILISSSAANAGTYHGGEGHRHNKGHIVKSKINKNNHANHRYDKLIKKYNKLSRKYSRLQRKNNRLSRKYDRQQVKLLNLQRNNKHRYNKPDTHRYGRHSTFSYKNNDLFSRTGRLNVLLKL